MACGSPRFLHTHRERGGLWRTLAERGPVMSTFAESTQRNFWKFTPAQINAARVEMRAAGCSAARLGEGEAAHPQETAAAPPLRPSSSSSGVEASIASTNRTSTPAMRAFAVSCKNACVVDTGESLTRLVYFKRCLRRSLLDPRTTRDASIYLAAKVEEEHATLRQLSKEAWHRPRSCRRNYKYSSRFTSMSQFSTGSALCPAGTEPMVTKSAKTVKV